MRSLLPLLMLSSKSYLAGNKKSIFNPFLDNNWKDDILKRRWRERKSRSGPLFRSLFCLWCCLVSKMSHTWGSCVGGSLSSLGSTHSVSDFKRNCCDTETRRVKQRERKEEEGMEARPDQVVRETEVAEENAPDKMCFCYRRTGSGIRREERTKSLPSRTWKCVCVCLSFPRFLLCLLRKEKFMRGALNEGFPPSSSSSSFLWLLPVSPSSPSCTCICFFLSPSSPLSSSWSPLKFSWMPPQTKGKHLVLFFTLISCRPEKNILQTKRQHHLKTETSRWKYRWSLASILFLLFSQWTKNWPHLLLP